MGFAPSNNKSYQSSETNIAGDTATKAFRKYPNNFLYSSYFSGSSSPNMGINGYYWSSTANSSYNVSYSLALFNSGAGIANSSIKYTGNTIRCTLGS